MDQFHVDLRQIKTKVTLSMVVATWLPCCMVVCKLLLHPRGRDSHRSKEACILLEAREQEEGGCARLCKGQIRNLKGRVQGMRGANGSNRGNYKCLRDKHDCLKDTHGLVWAHTSASRTHTNLSIFDISWEMSHFHQNFIATISSMKMLDPPLKLHVPIFWIDYFK
jgi:hypothetical protein